MAYKNKEDAKAWAREYYKLNREKVNARNRKSYWKHRDKNVARSRRYYYTHREELQHYEKERSKKQWAKRKALYMADNVAYANHRRLLRFYYAVSRLAAGKSYRPRMRLRVPDWSKFNQRIINIHSQFLEINLTLSQKAYAKEIYKERFCNEK